MSADELRVMAVELARVQKQRDDLAELARHAMLIAANRRRARDKERAKHVPDQPIVDLAKRLEAILRGDA